MKVLLSTLLSVSLSGSVIIALILAIRLLLAKAPRSAICLLWIMAGLRLLIPFQIESPLSLQPDLSPVIVQPSITEPGYFDSAAPDSAIVPENLPPDISIFIDNNAVTYPLIHRVDGTEIAALVWAAGAAALGCYALCSYWKLKRKLRHAIPVEKGVYRSDAIDSPFLLGYLNSRIYLPQHINEADLPHILAHERTHLKLGHHWIKLVGFICVAVHWFNPLVWLGYHLMCRDIEMACDESVVRHMDLPSRKAYSSALVNCSAQCRFSICNVAFGEVSVRQRVLSVLNYRKPSIWILLVILVVIGIIAGCFLTDPVAEPADPLSGMLQNKCAEAVRLLQSAESYFLYVTFQDNDPMVLSGASRHDYWRDGEDYLFFISTVDYMNMCLHTNGKYFRKNTSDAIVPEELAYPNWTKVSQPEQEFCDIPWIMSLEWEKYATEVANFTEQGSQQVINVTMTDINDGSSFILTFSFEGDSPIPTSIRRTHNFTSNGVPCISVSTIGGISLDRLQIQGKIQQLYMETQLQTIQ